ncbi:LysR family transcriptional regulator [Microbacterium sp. NPDC055910]|uniref:LysR family transcriptional regulator n=1 Tax=Microbacterium sp. NPDC055910 TaxID=3345659 RepID=UPI0035DD769A
MKIIDLQRFLALVADDLYVPRAAATLGIPLAALHSSIERLEAEVGHPIINRAKSGWVLTDAGMLLLEEAKRRTADAPAPGATSSAPAGGKAKASKGKGRAPVVKGQPKPYKKRQGR